VKGNRKWKKGKADYYYSLAKKEGYRSRAAYKLMQINSKYKLIRRGDVVIDLGCAPGGWLQVSRRIVGREGFVLGVDLQKTDPLPYENVKTLILDINSEEAPERILMEIPRKADVVISDASPKISGIWEIDHLKSVDLARASLKIASKTLKPGGNFLVKVFHGKDFKDFLLEVKEKFSFTKSTKPKASRKDSSESYVVAKGFKSS